MTGLLPSGSDAGPERPSDVFGRLHREIQKWIWQQGWRGLHSIQEETGRLILSGDPRDIVVAAPTAGGKTEAAFLPILTRVAGDTRTAHGFQVLYLAPLRALIDDQYARLSALCSRLDIEVCRWHGDVSYSLKRKASLVPRGAILTTPESLEAMFVLRGTQVSRLFQNLSYVVVDELHSFVGTERGRQVQSLLHRLETALDRRVPRIALSATLGDLDIAVEFLRPFSPGPRAAVISAPPHEGEVRIALHAFISQIGERAGPSQTSGSGASTAPAKAAICQHIYGALRGRNNLVFANSRGNVEYYSDRLARLCERARVPNEFWAHHGSLSKELRQHAERMLKDKSHPGTVVCTSTLELGIDVGHVAEVAQIGPSPSVASLRQRLGRSGRRDEPAVLRYYVSATELDDKATIEDRLRIELVQMIAQTELLLGGWCEPPILGALHLSTLLHQVLSVIAERGGARAASLWNLLCGSGPFQNVSKDLLVTLLRRMGQTGLVEQASDGTLLLGPEGERLVARRDFYAVFFTPDEYTLMSQGRVLGTLPIAFPLKTGLHIIFGGRRWIVESVDEAKRTVFLGPSRGGRVPVFSGPGWFTHEQVRRQMLHTYMSGECPKYLDKTALQLLAEGREAFRRRDLADTCLTEDSDGTWLVCWTSDRIRFTIQAELASVGCAVDVEAISLRAHDVPAGQLAQALEDISKREFDPISLSRELRNRILSKYDCYLDEDLLARDYASRILDADGTRRFLTALVGSSFRAQADERGIT